MSIDVYRNGTKVAFTQGTEFTLRRNSCRNWIGDNPPPIPGHRYTAVQEGDMYVIDLRIDE